ncbi:hypothetical protein B0T20DRAFT_344447 [Sordaria brevicollis]|uniref:Pleckstrin homology domain-containing protein n=1 Tax=Sordaria brevicollis TaxID=83679 RepID=A0AAE0PN89_SORBR|nr:hypothetical protein B0T20DRAFT_344447 [Sordaria brevicollis]
MGAWETEDEGTDPVVTLPMRNPSIRNRSRNQSRASRKSRRSTTPTNRSGSSSPPPLPADWSDKGSKRASKAMSTDENISILDPRRFTPTLHASLVSEILSLRRDQEEKLKIIEGLETSLQKTQKESESLQTTLLNTTKESRSLKRQLALLEGGTSSALDQLAKERDEAVESANDTKKRLENTQKKLRNQEEDVERVHQQWAKEKDEWEEEKRKLEVRIHVAESRLKVVLEEVTAFQAAQTAASLDRPKSAAGSETGQENDGASVRTLSLTNSIRFSTVSAMMKPNGTLADELGFDGDYEDESDYGGRQSVLSNRGHMRTTSRDSAFVRFSGRESGHMRNGSRDTLFSIKTHRRHQSTESLLRSASINRGKLSLNQSTLDRLEGAVIKEDEVLQTQTAKPTYVDTGIQYSPPPSPKMAPVEPSTPEPTTLSHHLYERPSDVDSPPRTGTESEPNQRRKRVQLGGPLSIKPPSSHNLMVNGSTQTMVEPLSPPRTPKLPIPDSLPTPQATPSTMVTSSTQTDIPAVELHSPDVESSTYSIPVISIIPPSSRPASICEPLLPPLSKDFGCQVSMPARVTMQSTGVQTEEIRVDLRLAKLPAHLHPSAIISRPVSPAVSSVDHHAEEARQFTPVPGNLPPRNPRRLTNKRSVSEIPSSPPIPASVVLEDMHDAYPGNNDDGPLSHYDAPIRRPHRISSLFAGFNGHSSDEEDFMDPADQSDSEYRTALSAPRPMTNSSFGKRSSGSTALMSSPEQTFSQRAAGVVSPLRGLEEEENDATDIFDSVSIFHQQRDSRDLTLIRTASRRSGRSIASKTNGIRRAALVQSGIASHSLARSPSFKEAAEPPFPIPKRASSRKPLNGNSTSETRGVTPMRSTDGIHRRGSSRGPYRANSIRKARPPSAVSRKRSQRRASRSPPPFMPPTQAPESPGLPPLPRNVISNPKKTDRSQRSAATVNIDELPGRPASNSSQSTSVVDAIAKTMVGEWMFKYVRRRKSFGMTDKNGDDSSNDRHKRWVWIAPYERAILWSSKQPSSGSALLGKSGRKLVIQSVLDVKDENPAPKGSGPLFDRSILILTPQRALKFTAVNAERHYLWLTALSFLAHSTQAIPENLAVPDPSPQPEVFELPKPKPVAVPLPVQAPTSVPVPKPKARRPIRDSIRLTKAKAAIILADPDRGFPPQMDEDSAMPPSIPTFRPTMAESYNFNPMVIHNHNREESYDSTIPPAIPRFNERNLHAALHNRKRSSTGGYLPPPISYRGFSGPMGGSSHAPSDSTAGMSVAGSSDIFSNAGASSVMGSSGMTWGTGSVSRVSESSSRPSAPNFFDAIGTVRMEAFIQPMAFTKYDDDQESYRYMNRRRSKEFRRRHSRSWQRDSILSGNTRITLGSDPIEDYGYDRDDPFKGF